MKTRTASLTLGLSALALASFSAPASAGIFGVSGQTTWLGSAPLSCLPGTLTGLNAYTWDEQTGVSLSLIADMVNNPGTSTAALSGPLVGLYDSHFIHFENVPGVVSATGSVTFNSPIVGVMFMQPGLDITDASCGSTGTLYPTGNPTRGLNTNPVSFVTINGNVLNFDFKTFSPASDVEQVRVFTKTPAPGAAAGLAMAGLLGNIRRRRTTAHGAQA